jgi:hypothetical protein
MPDSPFAPGQTVRVTDSGYEKVPVGTVGTVEKVITSPWTSPLVWVGGRPYWANQLEAVDDQSQS